MKCQPQYTTTTDRVQAYNLNERLANLCQRPERHGKDWRCNCPICGRHGLIISDKLSYSQVFCFHCKDSGLNDGWTEQRAFFVEAGELDPTERPKPKTREEIEAEEAEQRALANEIWNNPYLKPVTPENVAGKYLRSRGLESFIGHPALRFGEAMRHEHVWGYYCLLVSRVLHLHHGLTAVQLTPLLSDGSGRNKELHRKTHGVRKGGAVWINNPNPDEEVVVAEGLETCLSAMLLLKLRCGAAVLGTDFTNLVIPRAVRRIHLAVDNDESGRSAAEHSLRTLRSRGLSVRASMPAKDGDDFNDELMRRSA